MMLNEPKSPEVFIDEKFKYNQRDPDIKKKAVIDGLIGWANCSAGGVLPVNFGEGMKKISEIIGEPATPENLLKWEMQKEPKEHTENIIENSVIANIIGDEPTPKRYDYILNNLEKISELQRKISSAIEVCKKEQNDLLLAGNYNGSQALETILNTLN